MNDLDIYRRQNLGQSSGIGEVLALLLVDFQVGFNDPNEFGGGNIAAAVEKTRGLLEYARSAHWPIAFTRVVCAEDGSDAGVFCLKAPGLRRITEQAIISQIVPELAPVAGELIVRKLQPSAFFNTDLASWLCWRRVDTVVIAGCTTSGCVRASVVDAMSHNFRVVVPQDCVGDRAIGPHEANLFDMQQKYADVMTRDELLQEVAKRSARGSSARSVNSG